MSNSNDVEGRYQVSYETPVALERAAAWQKLRDLSAAHHYVPGLKGVEITTELREGVGASRRVLQGGGLALDETVIDWREGEGFSLRLHRGDKGPVPPMTRAWFDYGLCERDGQLLLCNRMRYDVGLGPLGGLLNSLLLRRVVAGAVRDTTLAQKLYYEGGEPVSKEALAAAKAELDGG